MKKTLIITEVFYPEDFLINEIAKIWSDSHKQIEVLSRIPSYPKGKTYKNFRNLPFQRSCFYNITIYHIPFIPGYQKNVKLKLLNYINYIGFSFIFLLRYGRKYDRIFFYQTGPISNIFAASILKNFFNWKIVIWVQDLWPDTVFAFGIKETPILKSFLNWFVKVIYTRSDEILVSCNGFIPKIKKFTNDKDIFWIPNWNIVDGATSQTIKLNGEFNFTFTGNVGKVQNLENLILAFDHVSKRYTNVFFNIVGDGSNLTNLKNFVDKHKIQNVVFHGRWPLETMPDFFNSSNVLVLSLVNYPIYKLMIPSKFQSYLHARKPIFSIVSGELNNLVDKYKIGLTAEPDDVESITNGFLNFLNLSITEKETMAFNSSNLESDFFDKKINVKKLTEVVFK
jgi:glycosyltransferase involved in cell wall biosynthesis